MPEPADRPELTEDAPAPREALDALFALAYDELRRAAHFRLRGQRAGATLSTTVLVHEAYVRLADQGRARAVDRAHFLALASRAMRFVLVDHVRARRTAKRGGAAERLSLDEVQLVAEGREPDLLALDEALDRLTAFSPRLGRLVECRFFGGLSYEEIAEVAGVSVPTVKRDWVRARAWLLHEMDAAAPGAG